MRPDERRKPIIERLGFRRHDTIQHPADEFGVSWLTIHRDIRYLEEEYPIVITSGNGGGVALPDGYYIILFAAFFCIQNVYAAPKITLCVDSAVSGAAEIEKGYDKNTF